MRAHYAFPSIPPSALKPKLQLLRGLHPNPANLPSFPRLADYAFSRGASDFIKSESKAVLESLFTREEFLFVKLPQEILCFLFNDVDSPVLTNTRFVGVDEPTRLAEIPSASRRGKIAVILLDKLVIRGYRWAFMSHGCFSVEGGGYRDYETVWQRHRFFFYTRARLLHVLPYNNYGSRVN